MSSPSVNNRIFLSSADRLTVCENNLVTLTLKGGESFDMLEPRRLFPVSRLDEYITLLDKDGAEIAVIRKTSDLDPASREVLEYSLNDYYLVPHITRILSVTEKYGTLHWSVETDRGFKEFDIRNRNHDVKVYPDGRVRVRDSDDNRYVISDYKALDKHSRSQLIADL
ncbi:MAG: DUF1854 domain-containing protein [Clostridia bacterium]|nr:DUF1854 domain-containing protein [Clostridia bacterium]